MGGGPSLWEAGGGGGAHLEDTRMRRWFRYSFFLVRIPGGREGSWEGAVGAPPPPPVPCCAAAHHTLLPLAVVGPKGFVTGHIGVEEEQWVLGDVLLCQQLVITDDVGQRQRCQLGCGVGDDGTEGGGSYGVGVSAGGCEVTLWGGGGVRGCAHHSRGAPPRCR